MPREEAEPKVDIACIATDPHDAEPQVLERAIGLAHDLLQELVSLHAIAGHTQTLQTDLGAASPVRQLDTGCDHRIRSGSGVETTATDLYAWPSSFILDLRDTNRKYEQLWIKHQRLGAVHEANSKKLQTLQLEHAVRCAFCRSKMKSNILDHAKDVCACESKKRVCVRARE